MSNSWWLWGVAIIVALWIFSEEKNDDMLPSVSISPPSPTSYQPPVPAIPVIPDTSIPTFMGYNCTVDCSGHEAGYEWAEENEITDPDECDGNSDSFIEGCQAYAEEQQEATEGEEKE